MPQQTSGAAVQPYYPAAAPTHYAQPYAITPATQYSLVSAGGRFGALLLDGLLILVTLWIGWFVWAMITWADGQTPAKKVLGQRTLHDRMANSIVRHV